MRDLQALENYCCTLYDTRDQLKRHILDRADQALDRGDRSRAQIKTLEQLGERQQHVKQAFLKAIGGLPQSESSLNAQTTRLSKNEYYTVENVIYESRPGHKVTSNLYLPNDRGEKTPAVLFLCGHEYEGKHSPYYHKVILRFVQAGFIVFAVDPIGQGERLSLLGNSEEIWGTREHQFFGVHCYLAGESVARYFIHDAMRAIDYLTLREEIDPQRIAVTGNSGGGTQTSMLMLCDERIAAAAPGTFITSRKSYMHAGGVQDAEQVWPGFSGQGFDHEDLLLAFAPKPLMVLAAQYDFFPIEGTRSTVDSCQKFWRLFGNEVATHLQIAEEATEHRYTDYLAQRAANFFRRHLFQDECKVLHEEHLPEMPCESLHCTKSGQVVLDDATAKSVRDEVVNRISERYPSESVSDWLNRQVFHARIPCEPNLRRIKMGEVKGDVKGIFVEYWMWWSQTGIMNSSYMFIKGSLPEQEMLTDASVSIGLWPGGTTRLKEHWEWIVNTCEKNRVVCVLNSSGSGFHEPHPLYGRPNDKFFGIMHKLADELLWLGDSMPALRTYDIVRCLDILKSSHQVDFYTNGYQELYAHMAAVIDNRVGQIESVNGWGGIANWIAASEYVEDDLMCCVIPGIANYLEFENKRVGDSDD